MKHSSFEPDKPLAFSYIRMSTRQQMHGDSERRQRENAIVYANENGLQLLEENQMADIGISAYRGKNVETGPLADFLEAVNDGIIPKGSFLILESLDRLSRQNVRKAMTLLLSILDGGINIVTLSDRQVYKADAVDPYDTQLIISLTIMMRANEESQVKGMRVAAAWKKKRSKIEEVKLTKRCPSWLTLSSDRNSFIVDEEKVAVINSIFSLSVDGLGSYAITSKLNHEQIPTLTGNPLWAKSSIEKLLKDRSVIGEFQPHRRQDGRREPEGIPNQRYFPKIVDHQKFLEVQQLRETRRISGAGRRGKSVPNLFTHTAKCYYCNEPLRYEDKGDGPKGGKYLRCSGAIRSSGCKAKSWRYIDFERSFLFFMRNAVDLSVIMNAKQIDLKVKRVLHRISKLENEIKTLEVELKRMFSLSKRLDPEDTSANAALDSITADIKITSKKIAEKKSELSQLKLETAEEKSFVDHGDKQYENSINQFQTPNGANSEEERLAVQKEIRAVVKSLLVAPNGLSDAPLLGKNLDPDRQYYFKHIVHGQFASIIGDKPVFRVKLVGGLDRTVVINPNDPQRCETMYEINDQEFRSFVFPSENSDQRN
jgi:DNA invertase Pin-like site-specific DNA recombinase